MLATGRSKLGMLALEAFIIGGSVDTHDDIVGYLEVIIIKRRLDRTVNF